MTPRTARGGLFGPALAGLLLLAGCANRPSELSQLRGLDFAITSFYADRAFERNGACLRPEMDIGRIELVERAGDRFVVDVRYFFEDRAFGRGSGRELRRSGGGACSGWAERRFTLEAGPDGRVRVLEMSGEQRGR
ncbi:MAG: hypothetical protein RMK81_08660 [Geminicoccaceae bacterium]|nr:hypothetical protein [Geminicoccaceae bacterium]